MVANSVNSIGSFDNLTTREKWGLPCQLNDSASNMLTTLFKKDEMYMKIYE